MESQFQNPAHPDTFFTIGRTYQKKTLKEARAPIIFISPNIVETKCKNYEVVVSIYADTTKATLLGTHRQLVQSRVDTDRVKSIEEFVKAIDGKGNSCGETISQGENLNFPIPSGWGLIHRSGQDNARLEEYLPFGHTVDNWQEMITVTEIHGQQATPETYLKALQESNWRKCPRPSKQGVFHNQEKGIPVATTILLCGHVPATDKAELSLIKALAGKDKFYVVHRQWRVPAGDPAKVLQALRTEINAGLEFLRNASICNTLDPEHRCEISFMDK